MDLDARIDRLEDALASLAQAQARTEERLGRLEEAVTRLAEAQARTEAALHVLAQRVDGLTQAHARTEAALHVLAQRVDRLAETQGRTEEELAALVGWQRGEAGRREGERYERELIRRAPVLFNGGEGGPPDERWVQERLAPRLAPLLGRGILEADEDPFLADVVWWKGAQVALVEISLQVNGRDVDRAARRAETLRRAGADVVAVVMGEEWLTPEVRDRAGGHGVEWKVGPELSEGFLAFRRRGPA